MMYGKKYTPQCCNEQPRSDTHWTMNWLCHNHTVPCHCIWQCGNTLPHLATPHHVTAHGNLAIMHHTMQHGSASCIMKPLHAVLLLSTPHCAMQHRAAPHHTTLCHIHVTPCHAEIHPHHTTQQCAILHLTMMCCVTPHHAKLHHTTPCCIICTPCKQNWIHAVPCHTTLCAWWHIHSHSCTI